jgi:hypothetical protein
MGSTAISSMKRAARAGAIAKRARRRRRLRRRDDALGVKWCLQAEPCDAYGVLYVELVVEARRGRARSRLASATPATLTATGTVPSM